MFPRVFLLKLHAIRDVEQPPLTLRALYVCVRLQKHCVGHF